MRGLRMSPWSVRSSAPRAGRARTASVAAAVVAAGLAPGLAPMDVAPLAAQEQEAQAADAGKAVYDRWCAECHGVEGDGNGPAAAWMLPRPRDFTEALYQIRTTPSGALPTDADILKVIDEGMPGTAMPGWEAHLSRAERAALVEYLKGFSRFFGMEDAPEPIQVSGAPSMNEEALENGRRLYQEIECWKCHGEAGRGDGPSAPTQTDDGGFPIRPADLSENWHFNGGGSLEAIYTRLRTGLDGTPMPSFSDLVDGGVITDEELWHLAGYVRSLSPEEPPEVRDVVRATRVEGELPASPSDEGWEDVERFYIPMVGQIIRRPRWFAPTVDGVWAQAVHNGDEVALRLTWHDPSESPDGAWEEWRALLADHMAPGPDAMDPDDAAPAAGGGADGAGPDAGAGADAGPGAAAGGAGPAPAGTGPSGADALTIQFPATLPEGRGLPYFLGGDSRDPVYLWRWRSDREGVEEALGRGMEQVEALPASDASPSAAAEFDRGEWRLVVRRRLASGDPGRRVEIPEGRAIPVAFFAQDGSSGETGARGSVSSWYYLWLDQPVAATVYVLPVAAALLTALLGLWVVSRARRAHRETSAEHEPDTILEGA